jgi:hypothetical protein
MRLLIAPSQLTLTRFAAHAEESVTFALGRSRAAADSRCSKERQP